ncbi:MAG TPA: amidase [Burkholderiales bacterium]|nr:amidase [Burkholderiales bacterium]
MTPNGFVHHAGGGEPGLRLAVKDNIDVAAMPCAAGMEPLRGRIAQRDALCVTRLKAAGYTIVGKTLMDEAAFGARGDNAWFGRCHNPRRRGFTPGGSSAGSAAAVAAGICDAALGTDTLGSVRIPASYCGVVGYVPGGRTIPANGVQPLMPEFDRVGVLARSVAVAARVASLAAASPLEPRDRGGVRVGWIAVVSAIPPIGEALEKAAQRLEARRLPPPPFEWGVLRRAALLLTEREGAGVYAALLDDPSSAISPELRAALEHGRTAGADRVARASALVAESKVWLAEVLRLCDVLLLPTTPQTAFAFDDPTPPSQADFTVPASVAALPAISVPAGAASGLPFGLQLVGRDDAAVLGVAARLV